MSYETERPSSWPYVHGVKIEAGSVLQAGWLRGQEEGRGPDKMPAPSFVLDAQQRYHLKWLKIDLQVCLPACLPAGHGAGTNRVGVVFVYIM